MKLPVLPHSNDVQQWVITQGGKQQSMRRYILGAGTLVFNRFIFIGWLYFVLALTRSCTRVYVCRLSR